MKIIDFIFALVCGRVVGFVVSDFLREMGATVSLWEAVVIWLIFPLLALFCLWIASLIGRKFLFIFQGAKHLLVGAFATVVDLKLFEFLGWLLAMLIAVNPLIIKSISFIFSTTIKYWGNKYWAFQKHEKENLHHEIIQFFGITFLGLAIDVAAFYCATKIVGPQFGLPEALWTKASVLVAALAAAAFNFLGYKFFVFKK